MNTTSQYYVFFPTQTNIALNYSNINSIYAISSIIIILLAFLHQSNNALETCLMLEAEGKRTHTLYKCILYMILGSLLLNVF